MKTQLLTHIQNARKDRNPTRVKAYQYVLSAIQAVEGREARELTFDECQAITAKEIKVLKEMIENKIAHDNEHLMIEVLERLLPEKIELNKYPEIVDQAIVEAGAASPRDMGKVINFIKVKYDTRIDVKYISTYVKEKLNALKPS